VIGTIGNIACVAYVTLATSVSPPLEAEATAPSAFDDIMVLASRTNAAEDTRQARARAAELVSAVEACLEPLADQTGSYPLAVPPGTEELELWDARASGLDDSGGDGLLVLATSGTLSHANGSVVIADGPLHISHARGSLIVATGGVDISHSSESVIIAGYYAKIGAEGLARSPDWRVGDPEFRARSSVISGNLVSIGHARGSLISAPGSIEITHQNEVIVVNSPPVTSSHGKSQELNLEALAYARRDFADLLRDVTVLHVLCSEREDGLLLTVADEEDFRAHYFERIEKRAGLHTSKLAGWSLVLFLSDRLVFESDGRYALVATREKPPDPMTNLIVLVATGLLLVLWAGIRLRGRN
jgi:hypothetical protein